MDPATLILIALGIYVLYQQSSATAAGSGVPGDVIDTSGNVVPGEIVDASPNPITQRLAQAIAVAEGFYTPGSRPARNHNPGDMTADLIKKAIGHDGMFVVYASDSDGWANLYAQINLWLDGKSAHAGPHSTIQQIADFYTTTQQAIWANNVADHLGVTVDTPIAEIA